MTPKQKAILFRNLTCASIGFLLLFFTSIFVIKGIFQRNIDSLIDEATILKDSKYPMWGQFPGTVDATYTHTATLYNLSLQTDPVPLPPITFDYAYTYSNMSFGQGNQGTIHYLNNWQRILRPSTPSLQTQNLTTINLALQRVYNYEYFSTQTRKFVLNFNFMWESFKNILPRYYGLYLNQFYLHDKAVVSKAIFDVMGISTASRQLILNHWRYGWSNSQNLGVWFKLAHLRGEERVEHPEFELIREACSLSGSQMLNLVGEKSVIFKLSQALNGTIQNRVEANGLDYQECTPFCSDDQLIATQLVTGFLTNLPLMGSLSLNKSFNDLNTSYPFPIQYETFCQQNPDLTCVNNQNSIILFTKLIFNNFTQMSKVFQNRNNNQLVQNLFEVENPMGDGSYGQSLIAYADYLHTFVFNSYDQQGGKQDEDSYKFMFPNHQFMVENINYLRNVLEVELVSTAMINQIENSNLSCLDFYGNGYSQYAELCSQQETDPTQPETTRLFVRAYFFQNRQLFKNMTSMSSQTATQFLRLDTKDSLFALKIQEIQQEIATSADCEHQYCDSLQLLVKEWAGNNPILSNLPRKYFQGGEIDLFDLDYQNKFNRVDPRYWKIMGQKLSDESASKLLNNGKQSIMVLLNLMNYKFKSIKSDPFATKIVQYVQKTVVDTYFSNYLTTSSVQDVINGFKASGIEIKRGMDPMKGGAPWLSPTVALFDTKHTPTAFSKLNTGIYQKDKLRNIIQIQEHTMASSSYTVFGTQYEMVQQTLLSNKAVSGTNLLGFQQDISSSDKLSVYIDAIQYGATLKLIDSDYVYNKNISARKYSFNTDGRNVSIGIEGQNQRYVVIDPNSYMVIEPVTGLTLQISMKYSTYTTLSSLPLYSPDAPVPQLLLFDMNISYLRQNVNSLNQIADVKFQMSILFMITIGLAALSMLLIITFSILTIRSHRKTKLDLIQSLMDQDKSSSIV